MISPRGWYLDHLGDQQPEFQRERERKIAETMAAEKISCFQFSFCLLACHTNEFRPRFSFLFHFHFPSSSIISLFSSQPSRPSSCLLLLPPAFFLLPSSSLLLLLLLLFSFFILCHLKTLNTTTNNDPNFFNFFNLSFNYFFSNNFCFFSDPASLPLVPLSDQLLVQGRAY